MTPGYNHMFYLLCLVVVLLIFHLGFEGGNSVMISPVPGHFFHFLKRPIIAPTASGLC